MSPRIIPLESIYHYSWVKCHVAAVNGFPVHFVLHDSVATDDRL